MKLATTTAPFTLDPTLNWLRTDPAMQQHEAFVGMRTVKLTERGWAPMGLYFPGGTTLAMVQVTSVQDLTPGLYWHEHIPTSTEMYGVAKGTILYTFGRFEGFGDVSRSEASRHKKGRAHFELGSDTLDCDLYAHRLSADGTSMCYVNFGNTLNGNGTYKLWRITHYVDMPGDILATLGVEAAGPTADQLRWLNEEKQLQTLDCCSEYSAHTLGIFPGPDCRAVLRDEENREFATLFHHLPDLLPSQAKKRKFTSVAIAWRSYDYTGKPIGYTKYFKREDASVLLDLLQNRTDLERAAARVIAASSALAATAAIVRDKVNAEVRSGLQEPKQETEPSRELALAA